MKRYWFGNILPANLGLEEFVLAKDYDELERDRDALLENYKLAMVALGHAGANFYANQA